MKKILIVEGEKSMARALELKLASAGFETRHAEDAETAITLLAKEPPDLVVLELMLPHADGFQFLTTLKEKGNAPPIFVLTNLSQEEDEKKARGLGAREYFTKSETPLQDFVKKVKETLGVV